MIYRCVLCDEDYTKGYKIGNDFYCRRCLFEKLEDELGVKEVC